MNSEKTTLLIGFRAARANLVPGLIVQTLMIATVAAYYLHPSARSVFEVLARAKQDGGFAFTLIVTMIAGGILPEALTVAVFQKGKITRTNIDNLLFTAIFWACNGVIVDLLYQLQAVMFGAQVNLATVVKKVVFDEFIYNPVLAAPLGMACYEWKNQRYSFAGLSRVLTLDFYKTKTLPALVATWCIWIPVTSMVYSLPPLLQIPLFSLALTFWVMMFAYITSKSQPAA